MRLSVIIPLYNKAPYVRRALDSVAAQTMTDFELIVVDDGSTDEGAQIVASYPDTRLQLIRQANAGPGAARNRGLTVARGELIAFLDADDEWLPEYLAESVRLLDQYGPEVATVTSGYFEDPTGASTEPLWHRRGLRAGVHRVTPDIAPAEVVSRLAYMSPCTTVARREAVTRWGGFYERDRCRYAEDAMLWLKVLLNERVAFNLKPLARFHREAAGLSQNLAGARPVEPFLVTPEEVEAACPAPLRELLKRVLATRAFKTACVLGYWGQWREAGAIMRRFATAQQDWRLPYYLPALVCRTPLGAGLGKAWRALRAQRTATSTGSV